MLQRKRGFRVALLVTVFGISVELEMEAVCEKTNRIRIYKIVRTLDYRYNDPKLYKQQ